MTPTHGVCTNLPEACGLAASSQPQPMTHGHGRCSGCGAALMVPATALAQSGGAGRWRLPLLAALSVGAVVAGWLMLRTPQPDASAATAAGLAVAVSGVAAAGSAPPPLPDGVKVPTIRMQGSNTVGAALAPALVRAFLAREGYSEVGVTPVAAEEQRLDARRPTDGARLRIELAAHGTATGFTALAAGKTDIGMASRAVQAKELEATQALGDLSAEGSEYIIALDGVAVIVHPSNPLKQLTLAQLRDLFTGKVTDWSALGGPAGAVHLHARDEKSGTWDTFRALVLDKAALATGAARHEDSRELAAAVAADPMAVGFVGLPYADAAKTLALADGQGAALRPSRFTVATEDYALSRRLYFYVARDALPLARRLADFAVSEEGQKAVNPTGFVGQLPEADTGAAVAAADVPAEYQRLTQGAQRLAVNLRFRPGADRLDNKALRDIGRITRLLERGGSRQLMLLGFSDDRGERCTNVALSQQRARAVASELSTYGVRPAVVQGYGPAAAVASNDSEAGRERNRRVEVWVMDRAAAVPQVGAPAGCGRSRPAAATGAAGAAVAINTR
ncbi:MAG: hypothetical protein RLZZ592_1228 [Pseudomonadota bacterium]|jgi:phosphate transport system substrate-binding protein